MAKKKQKQKQQTSRPFVPNEARCEQGRQVLGKMLRDEMGLGSGGMSPDDINTALNFLLVCVLAATELLIRPLNGDTTDPALLFAEYMDMVGPENMARVLMLLGAEL